ncbi:serine/threonine-protein kinase [Streptomyces albicerus]|uniref:serine/threonine-protein kinase n=1 Tax=Streptomyces albicerus TaxID=2569859 RepID=UPI00124AFF1C|nr:serine/threonine-protein kinase [Streptomyces albicerus]
MRIAGRYRLAETVGQGGMGRVWRARDEMLDRAVAVKELRLDGDPDAEDPRTRRERARREALAGARIDHPNVVRIYDVAEEADRLWIVMELVDAPSLERVVLEDGTLGVTETARVGLALVEALRRVHAAGVLHRDIKPGNVLLAPDGRVVLTDFGIATVQDARSLTRTGVLVGSPEYIPPERATGRPPGPPADLWALGATLCTALTGRSPFARGSTAETLLAIVYEEPELPGGDCPLTPLLRRMLAKDPGARPGVDEIIAYLTPLAAASPSPENSPGELPAESPGDWRPRLLTALVLIVAAAVAAVMIVTAIDPGGETRLPDTSEPPTVAGTSRPPSSSPATDTPTPPR